MKQQTKYANCKSSTLSSQKMVLREKAHIFLCFLHQTVLADNSESFFKVFFYNPDV